MPLIPSTSRRLLTLVIAGAAATTSAETTSPHFGDHIFAHGFDEAQQIQVDVNVLDIGEAGSAPLGVRLALAPPGNVTVFLESSDVGAATVSPASLTFTPANFATFQSATVSGADDVDSSDEVVPMLLWSSGINDEFFTVNVSDDDRVLSVVRAGTGNGTVTSSPAGINCGADCTETYGHGTMVALTASPAAGSTFAGWSGDCTGTGTCNVSMTAARSVTATFTQNTYSLTVSRAGTGIGTVTSSPAGINCGVDCAETYGHGTVVMLTAAPSAGSAFAGWSGGGCTGTGACVVTMTAATTVTATFTLNTYTLSLTRAGTGSGTVTSSPAGINCGADCSETYGHGTVVTLTAAPAVGSSFSGWSGGGCTGTGTCAVTMTAATAVTATFTL